MKRRVETICYQVPSREIARSRIRTTWTRWDNISYDALAGNVRSLASTAWDNVPC